MTSEELSIIRTVLRESWRLSNGDADALTLEIARRVELRRPIAHNASSEAADLRSVLSSAPEPCKCHGDPWCEDDK